MEEKITPEDMIRKLGLNTEVKFAKRIVVRWFSTIILCALVQVLFFLISEYFTGISRQILTFGGWASCIVYYTRTYKITAN